MKLRAMAVVMLALGGAVLVPAARGEVSVSASVSVKDAQADFEAGKYPECLKKIQSLLTSSTRPTPAQRAELLLLKAECMLQQKQVTPAAEAFVLAGNAYEDKQVNDKAAAAKADATAVLIRKASALQYTPKTGTDKEPISVLDKSVRAKALTALFNDEFSAEEQVYKNAMAKANMLMPVVDFAPRVKELGTLELAATGSDAKVEPMSKALAAHAKTTMETGISILQKSADAVATSATTMVDVPQQNTGGGRGTGGKNQKPQQPKQQKERGLTESDRTTLQGLITSAEKIPPAVKTLTANLGLATDYYKTQLTEALAIKKRAEAMLGGNYKAK